MTSTNFDNHYNEFFFFSNTMNLHQIHISYRIWNWTTHEPWISLFGNHFRVENIFGKNIHLLTTLRQIIHETKDFGIDVVIHNALKKKKTDFSLFILFRKMKALPCTDFLENLWNDSHTKSFFGEQYNTCNIAVGIGGEEGEKRNTVIALAAFLSRVMSRPICFRG